jgi:dihydroneopterin aldolase
MLRVYLRDFVLPVRIGVNPDEQGAPQRVRFDVLAEVQPPRGEAEGIGQILSYDAIRDHISAVVAEGHIDFAETLAARVAGRVLREPLARRVTVTVEKLERGPGRVGVEIVMEQSGEARP